MNAVRICLVLIYFFSDLRCVNAQVNSESAGMFASLKGLVTGLDSADLAGEANVGAMHELLNREFRVLGIGEQSHGTSEFFAARLMLIKAFADDPSFTKIGLEAPMAEVEQLNTYLLDGRGDMKEILRSFRLYGYECAEFADLVENVGRLGKARGKAIRFFGFDMQSPFRSLQNLRDSGVPSDVAVSLSALLKNYELLNNEIYAHMFSKADFAELKASSNRVLGKLESTARTNMSLRKNMNNYRQFLLLNDPENAHELDAQSIIRDSLMAENVLMEVEPGKKIIILAHNAHLQRTPNVFSKSTGSFLARKLGSGYQCFALTTSFGFYTTFNPAAGHITDKNILIPGDSATFEYHFSKVDQPAFFFRTSDLKKKMEGHPMPSRYRLVVYGLTENQFFDGNILNDFDYVLQIKHTSGNRSFYLK